MKIKYYVLLGITYDAFDDGYPYDYEIMKISTTPIIKPESEVDYKKRYQYSYEVLEWENQLELGGDL